MNVDWTLENADPPFGLTFLGLSSAPGTSFSIVDSPGKPEVSCLPEPSGALGMFVGAGLVARLASRRRRR